MTIRQGFTYIFASVLLVLSGCKSLNTTVRDLGYTPAALGSSAHRPGKVVMIVKEDPFQGPTVCKFGSYIGSPSGTKDVAASIQASEKLSGTFSLGADYLKQISGKIGAQYIKDINVTLSNVSVEEISDDEVFEGLKSQQPSCSQAIENLMHPGNRLGFLQSALKADALYKVTFENKAAISAEMQKELLRGLAVQIGASSQSVSENQINGSNLYWGVVIREDLVKVAPSEKIVKVSAKPLEQAVLDALAHNKYEFGWSGNVYGSPDQKIEYYPITKMSFLNNNFVVFKYARPTENEVSITVSEHKLAGIWKDEESGKAVNGELEMVFDDTLSHAVGWWNYGGQMQKYNAYLRRVE